ncbi:MAG: hypothetical protein C0514_03270 [Candidatus Puniceispirillum sp.]|nr:hypothetical protein [Candidatus Puniceispirillum sp.]
MGRLGIHPQGVVGKKGVAGAWCPCTFYLPTRAQSKNLLTNTLTRKCYFIFSITKNIIIESLHIILICNLYDLLFQKKGSAQ